MPMSSLVTASSRTTMRRPRAFSGRRVLLPYREAADLVRSVKLTSVEDFQDWNRQHPHLNVPQRPDLVYRSSSEWHGFPEFLGNPLHCRSRNGDDYLSYDSARNVVHALQLRNPLQFFEFVKDSSTNNTYPAGLPRQPYLFYKKRGDWKGWPDFLGYQRRRYGRGIPPDFFKKFDESREIVQRYMCRTYRDFCVKRPQMPPGIPSRPDLFYRRTLEWTNWYDFLGEPLPAPRKGFDESRRSATETAQALLQKREDVIEEVIADLRGEGRSTRTRSTSKCPPCTFEVVRAPRRLPADVFVRIRSLPLTGEPDATTQDWVPVRVKVNRSRLSSIDPEARPPGRKLHKQGEFDFASVHPSVVYVFVSANDSRRYALRGADFLNRHSMTLYSLRHGKFAWSECTGRAAFAQRLCSLVRLMKKAAVGKWVESFATQNQADQDHCRFVGQIDSLIYRPNRLSLAQTISTDPCPSTVAGYRVLHKTGGRCGSQCGYRVSIVRHHGQRLMRPYRVSDNIEFLVVFIKDSAATTSLCGCFIFPRKAIETVFTSKTSPGCHTLTVFPPWVTPRYSDGKTEQEGQLPYYIDFRGLVTDSSIAAGSTSSQHEVIAKAGRILRNGPNYRIGSWMHSSRQLSKAIAGEE
ncbi:unnamed protein product [Amoebophrya sp. A25]|nr:unnamed protein product [Amoebophrya sp. A25]|eukprot:GSA25T00005757001.1